jgi:hypothetical protein
VFALKVRLLFKRAEKAQERNCQNAWNSTFTLIVFLATTFTSQEASTLASKGWRHRNFAFAPRRNPLSYNLGRCTIEILRYCIRDDWHEDSTLAKKANLKIVLPEEVKASTPRRFYTRVAYVLSLLPVKLAERLCERGLNLPNTSAGPIRKTKKTRFTVFSFQDQTINYFSIF